MGVIIKNMDMPESCFGCAFCSPLVIPDEIYFCDCPVFPDGLDITEAVEEDYRHSDCPLVEVLIIDADELKESIDNAQTVVEAEGENA